MSRRKKIAKDFIENCWGSQYDLDCVKKSVSKSCQHRKTIGICYGSGTFIADCHDWTYAFPDYGTILLSTKEYDHIVICEVMRYGTHLKRYKSTNPLKNTDLKPTGFMEIIEKIEPTGRKYLLPATLIFTFEKDLITKIVIEEEPDQMPKALGIAHLVTKKFSTKPVFDYSKIQAILAHIAQTPLSPREIDCITLTLHGLSAKHIAQILQNSYRTVEKILSYAYEKLGVQNKQDMIEKIYENHLITAMLDLGKDLLKV